MKSSVALRMAAAAVLVLTGCSSAKHAAAPAVASSPASTVVRGADETAIRRAFTTFLNPTTSVAESVSLLQDGSAFASTLGQASTLSLAKSASVTVTSVTLTSPTKATVVYSILLGGSPVLENTSGYAVREDGNWKVSGATFCGLLQIVGTPPPVCNQAAATAIPS